MSGRRSALPFGWSTWIVLAVGSLAGLAMFLGLCS